MTEFLIEDAVGEVRAQLLLAHGAGAPMDSEFMHHLAHALAAQGVRVLRFEFAYMAARRHGGNKRPPPPIPVLLQEYRQAIEAAGGGAFLLGGKSLGGRVASLLAMEQSCAGVVCFGYPFHPPGKPEKLRTAHLQKLRAPILICQGERDPFGSREEVSTYALAKHINLHWLAAGNHDFKAARGAGVPWPAQFIQAAQAVSDWLR